MEIRRSALRPLLARGPRIGRAVLRRARTGLQVARRAREVPMQITLDGLDLVNWRSPDPTVQGLVLRGGPGTVVTSGALLDEGPPHGHEPLKGLEEDVYTIRARTARGERPVRVLPAGDGTRNEARDPSAGSWQVVAEPTPQLVRRPAGTEAPGLLALEAAHGLVALDIGPFEGDWELTLERRDREHRIAVQPRPYREGPVRVYRLGKAQWQAAALPTTGERTVWDVILRSQSAPDRRRRVAWRGSGVALPREAIRLRAVVSYGVPGQRVEVRPYWTKDQNLALELTATPSIGGDLS